PNGGKLTISLDAVTVDQTYVDSHPEARTGNFVRLRVADTGCGMDPATLAHIFEPFFTTKEIGKGTGLGLATVYGIVKQHEGWIEPSSTLAQGTTFDIYFPVAVEPAELEPVVEAKAAPPVVGGAETIMVVEDEEVLRQMARDILQDCGYKVLEAADGKEALALWKRNGEKIDMLLTDLVMPEGISGVDLAERLLADRPDLRVIFTSGYSTMEISEELMERSQAYFLQKPYTHITLAKSVRDCLDKKPQAYPVD
ncbi:MAG TPA: response regulator, partial [Desulfuromonadaceae bacterium]|nr:response regulator [Desulfuromonadaceae bacterium]